MNPVYTEIMVKAKNLHPNDKIMFGGLFRGVVNVVTTQGKTLIMTAREDYLVDENLEIRKIIDSRKTGVQISLFKSEPDELPF